LLFKNISDYYYLFPPAADDDSKSKVSELWARVGAFDLKSFLLIKTHMRASDFHITALPSYSIAASAADVVIFSLIV